MYRVRSRGVGERGRGKKRGGKIKKKVSCLKFGYPPKKPIFLPKSEKKNCSMSNTGTGSATGTGTESGTESGTGTS